MDLRRRLLAAIDEGMSCRAAAVRFGVAPATAIRWQAQRRDTGSFAPRAIFDLSESKGDSLGLRFLIQNPCW
jgi:transposase